MMPIAKKFLIQPMIVWLMMGNVGKMEGSPGTGMAPPNRMQFVVPDVWEFVPPQLAVNGGMVAGLKMYINMDNNINNIPPQNNDEVRKKCIKKWTKVGLLLLMIIWFGYYHVNANWWAEDFGEKMYDFRKGLEKYGEEVEEPWSKEEKAAFCVLMLMIVQSMFEQLESKCPAEVVQKKLDGMRDQQDGDESYHATLDCPWYFLYAFCIAGKGCFYLLLGVWCCILLFVKMVKVWLRGTSCVDKLGSIVFGILFTIYAVLMSWAMVYVKEKR